MKAILNLAFKEKEATNLSNEVKPLFLFAKRKLTSRDFSIKPKIKKPKANIPKEKIETKSQTIDKTKKETAEIEEEKVEVVKEQPPIQTAINFEEPSKNVNTIYGLQDFLIENPQIKYDLKAEDEHLKKDVDWKILNTKLKNTKFTESNAENSLKKILTYYPFIIES